jgi:hypothetical protein
MIALHHHCPCAISQKNYYDADPNGTDDLLSIRAT